MELASITDLLVTGLALNGVSSFSENARGLLIRFVDAKGSLVGARLSESEGIGVGIDHADIRRKDQSIVNWGKRVFGLLSLLSVYLLFSFLVIVSDPARLPTGLLPWHSWYLLLASTVLVFVLPGRFESLAIRTPLRAAILVIWTLVFAGVYYWLALEQVSKFVVDFLSSPNVGAYVTLIIVVPYAATTLLILCGRLVLGIQFEDRMIEERLAYEIESPYEEAEPTFDDQGLHKGAPGDASLPQNGKSRVQSAWDILVGK